MTLPLRILIVEDSADDAEVALLELARGGIAPDARRVETADEMRSALAEGPWDAVLSDYTMPGFGAAEAFALSRAADPDLPFVVVSGTIGEQRAVEMMRAGAGDYLLKGNLARLAAAVTREVLAAEGRRGRRGAERKARDLAAIVASSDDAILGKTLDGTVTSWNAGAERLYGYAAGEIVGRSIAPLISPDRPDEEADLLGRVARGERVDHFETERVRQDGTRVYISITLSPVRDEAGRVVGASAIARDIGDRKRQDAALRASEARLLRAQQVANVGSWETDPATLEVTWSDETYRIFEVEPQTGSITHARFLELVHAEDRTRVHQAFLESLTHCSPCEITHRIRTHDGTIKFVEEHWQVETNERGKPVSVVGTCQDVTDRTRSEEVLRHSEERYRSLVDATAAIVWDTPASGAFDSEQPGWTTFTGQTVERYRGRGWLNAVHPDDREKSARAWEAAVATQTVYLDEHRLRKADGGYRHMTVRTIPILDGGGTIREWVGVHTDVTERQRADSDRRELLDRLNLQIERMPLAYLLTGPDFRYTRWNPAAERLFGFAEAEVLGRHPFDVVVPARARPRVGELFDRLKGGDMNAHGTSENVTRDDRTITCEWYNTPLFDAAGTFTGVLSLAQDVTERKRLAEQYHQAERRLHHVVASSPVVLFTLALAADQIRGLDWIGENLRNVLGHRPEEALSPDWWRANVHPEDLDRATAQAHDGLFGHGHATHEYRFRHGDGDYRWTRGEMRLIRDAAGRPVEVVGSWSDITERKSLEEQFRQAQKMEAFGQLAGGVAHDFNNLLTIINGYSELLLDSLPAADPNRALLVEINQAGERSAGLTRQLLAFSRQQVLAPRVLDLNAVVADTASLLRRVIGEDVSLAASPAPGLWPVMADAGQVEQVLLNLAVNARDAMPTGGRLTIETQNVELDEGYAASHADARSGPHVLLAVWDTGHGMPPDVVARIFEPFFTTKEVGKGTGLGLATVYGIVKQSGGHIKAYSEVGAGTTFKVYLPRAGPAAGVATAKFRPAPARGTETVLVVEDEAAVRGLTRHILQYAGYTVLEADGGDEAVRVASGHAGPIHLVVTDVVLPGTGGRKVAEAVQALHGEANVLFVSGYTDDAVVRHGILHAGVNFLQKPFTPTSLTQKVRDVLDAPREGVMVAADSSGGNLEPALVRAFF